MGKHSGNIAGGIGGIDAAIVESVRKQIATAAETAVPMVGSSWRANKQGGAELVIVGKHDLGLNAVAISVDPINALKLAAAICEGVSDSMLQAAQMARGMAKPAEQGD